MQSYDIEIDKRKMILRDFENGLTHIQAKDNIVKKYGNCVGYGERTCERWFTKFKRQDFDLTKKPRDKVSKKNRDYHFKKKKRPRKPKQNTVNSNQDESKNSDTMNCEVDTTVQKIIESRPHLTIVKVTANSGAAVKKLPLESDVITKRLINSTASPVAVPKNALSNVTKEKNTAQFEMPKLRPRRPRSKGIEIQLPVSAAKRMNPQTLTESHNIGEVRKRSNRTETSKTKVTERPASREVTVQFQNLSPEVAKNTVRKKTNEVMKRQPPLQLKPQHAMLKITNVAHVERMSPEKSVTTDQTVAEVPNKRATLPQASPLTNQKGIIYLNPQEIFPQSFGGMENSMKRPSPYLKSAQQIHKKSRPLTHLQTILTPPERQDYVTLCDSDDSGEDILFPENIRLPAPKIKTDTTYTTYWDMKSGEQIPINAMEPILAQPAVPVIEID